MALTLDRRDGRDVVLLYRQADQSQSWRRATMTWRVGAYRAAIPADYTASSYPLLYYFELHEAGGSAIFPGFGPDLSNQPYFMVRSARGGGSSA